MESSLMNAVWFSDKRRKLLLFLLKGRKDPEEIKKAFGVSWRSLILPLKELKEEELIINHNGSYELSSIGKMLAENVRPIDRILNLFEGSTDYWTDRDFKGVPPHLLNRIGEIEDYTIIEPDLNNMFEPPERFLQSLHMSKRINAVFSIYHPLYPALYCQLAKKGIPMSLILTEPVLQRMREDCKEETENIRQLQNTTSFLYNNEIVPPSLVITDNMLLISFFTKGGRYDHRDVMSFSKSSLQWGEHLFDHYRSISHELPELLF
jgi:predicted transcriptional regulator